MGYTNAGLNAVIKSITISTMSTSLLGISIGSFMPLSVVLPTIAPIWANIFSVTFLLFLKQGGE